MRLIFTGASHMPRLRVEQQDWKFGETDQESAEATVKHLAASLGSAYWWAGMFDDNRLLAEWTFKLVSAVESGK